MSYQGTLDESKVSDLIVRFGELVEEEDEMGFILTYHVSKDSTSGAMDLAGRGIDHATLGVLLAGALERNAERGCTH